MASGFITLSNGDDWYSRWSRYDYVLEQIMNELQDVGEEAPLKAWLKYMMPDEEAGDIECGYCFIKSDGEESVLRILDSRRMQDKYQQIFWAAAEKAGRRYPKEMEEGILIHMLLDSYHLSLAEPAKEPDLDNDTLNHIFFIGGFNIGKWQLKDDDE